MNLEAYGRVRALYDALVDLDPAEQERALAASDAAPELLALVRSMLSLSPTTQDVNAPVMALMGALASDTPAPQTQLGAWTVAHKIGEGGMGTVYAARRSDGHFEQDAAVKVLRGLPSAAALEYLARERQILAGLAHPNIARLLDGGTTPQGQPFLVMEYLEGMPIDRWCRERRPDARALLRLMLPICGAVAYAHTRLVVHCDLKPSNVLVRADGHPFLLDFGIARVLGDAARGPASSTSQRARAFTPGFASPEQQSGGAISTSTDVYSLGRLIEHLALQSGIAIDHELRAIVARATATESSARYESIAALGADLQRYLEHLPLQAVPAHVGYRTRKWLQRRWPWALTSALFALVVIGFTVQLARDRDRALAAEQRALAERDRATAAEQAARQVSDFVVSILDGANPDAGGAEVPVSQLVEQALARIETELAGQPAMQAELYTTLANVQTQLRIPEAAQNSFERAVAIERTLGRPLPLARSALRLAGHVRQNGATDAALTHAREALALYQALGPDAPAGERQQAMRLLGQTLLNTPQSAEGLALLRSALADAESNGPNATDLAFALLDLGGGLHLLGELDEAERHLRRSYALFRAHDEHSVETVNAQEVLARVLVARKQLPAAESLLRDALERRRALHGADDVNTPWRLSELGAVLDADGRSKEALPLYAEAVALAERKFGADTLHHAVLLQNQGRSQFRAGALEAADSSFRRALATLTRAWGEGSPAIANARTNHGQVLLAMTSYAEASRVLASAERVLAAQQPGSPVDLAQTRVLLAEADWRFGRRAEADRMLALAEDTKLDVATPTHAHRLQVRALLRSDGDDEAAIVDAFLAAEAAWKEAVSAGDPRVALARLDRAEWLARRGGAQGRTGAQVLASQILDDIDGRIVADSPWRARIARLQTR